jgi:hypothetical protein
MMVRQGPGGVPSVLGRKGSSVPGRKGLPPYYIHQSMHPYLSPVFKSCVHEYSAFEHRATQAQCSGSSRDSLVAGEGADAEYRDG